MASVVKVQDQDAIFKFVCEDEIEMYRANTLLTKEEGTIRWLKTIKPGCVMYDIGANIGIYTIVAAHYVGSDGMVYAFEPQIMNASSLLRNIKKNNFQNRVKVLTCALHDHEGFIDFNYNSMRTGSSGSQLGHVVGESGNSFSPEAVELKFAVTLDRLINSGTLRPPDFVKLDVDGNELLILRGMGKVLASSLRSIQIELHPKDSDAVIDLLKTYGFELKERHYTLIGKKLLKEQGDSGQIVHNAIFSREG